MSRKLILASTMTMVLAGTDASALGLGGLNTQSVLNQPFLGEIGLEDAKPDELDAIKASLASTAAFEKAGIERYYYLTKLTFVPEVTPDGRVVLRVSSREPIREPYMDFLVEVVWSSGKLLKEYTVLLDPPVLADRGAPAIANARANSARAGRPAEARSRSTASSSRYIPAPGDGFPVYVGPIRPGKGLWRVASENAPSGATVAQTAMALYRNNQDAFIRGDIDRLRVGRTLVIPTGEELFALDATQAEREYADALRGRAVRRSPITDIPPGALDARLRIAGSAQRTAAVDASTANGAIPSTTRSAVPAPAVEQDVLRALETSESTRQETLELRDRIRELETQLSGIQDILQLRNAELARIQSQMAAPGVLGDQAPPLLDTLEQPPETQEPPLPDEDAGRQTAAESLESPPGELARTSEGDVSPEAETMLPPPDAAATLEEVSDVTAEDSSGLVPLPLPVPVPEEPPETEPAVEPPVAEPPKPAQVPPSAPPVEEPPPSTWDSLLLPLAGLASVTAIGILLFSWISLRRKRREEASEDADEVEHDKDLLFGPLDETTEPRSMDVSEKDVSTTASPAVDLEKRQETSAPAVQTSSNRTEDKVEETGLPLMSSLSNFDAETDEADILSEADIYIAYGRHSEAQDLLRAELKRTPERIDIKYKLAEVYAGAKDMDALNGMLAEIESSGADRADPAMWRRLQELKERLLEKSGDAEDETRRDSPRGAAAASSASGSVDSMEFDADDSFSLDISDLQKASSDLAGGPRLDEEEVEFDLDLEDGAPLKISDELLEDLADEPRAGFGLDSDHDSFGAAPTVAVSDEGGFTSEKQRQDSVQIESEMVLSLDDRRVEVVDDLDSIFDSGAMDDPTLARNEAEGARPTGPKGERDLSAPVIDTIDSSDQESVPTDLLSSQWQMDSGIWDETATKLDLARAYIEMDDAEAAREILEEVVAEGREEQRSEAQEMLSKLG
ncbi:FimV/HubP family polar landmark protein [Imhoffiella purpurea]|uniref:FimV N-terminal domain-containing protein n=1 Tax=Imhoffiella purpurea TaxID=1249627 RepID=W9VF69_9GAMM|nr:FimV/HubP family polar landmark protein [Imhoffiella purpurea]EXJ14692.1 hypothetical protein D779_2221 [Imhoffiella purpurea]